MPYLSRIRTCLSTVLLGAMAVPFLPSLHAQQPGAPDVALRELSDGMGYTKAPYYKTIQAVDLNGDGQSEVLSRWIDGLHVYRFASAGALVQDSFLPEFADAIGFNDPSYYETIRAGVLKPGSLWSDILVRESDGMHVFRRNVKEFSWHEIGATNGRPFANGSTDGTDWTRPEYFETIQVADLDHNGTADLIARGANGMVVYSWNEASGSWTALSLHGPLADADGGKEAGTYRTLQLTDLDGDGTPEILARTAAGVIAFTYKNGSFTPLTHEGPFKTGTTSAAHLSEQASTIRSTRDGNGQVWLSGIENDEAKIYKWNGQGFRAVSTIPVPSSNADLGSHVLLPANIVGDATPEYLLRAKEGIVAYSAEGKRLKYKLDQFANAEGGNLEERYATLTMASLAGPGAATGEAVLPVLMGRDGNGLKAFKFTTTWTRAADTNFPNYCADSNGQSCIAYQCLSAIGYGQVNNETLEMNLRETYKEANLERGFFQNVSARLLDAYAPTTLGGQLPNCGTVPQNTWTQVQTQLKTETALVATAKGWFSNTRSVMQSEFQLASGDVDYAVRSLNNIDGGTVVDTQWANLGTDVASGLVGNIPVIGGYAQTLIAFIRDLVNMSLPGSDSDTINNLYTSYSGQVEQEMKTSDTTLNNYLQDWGNLQQLSGDAENFAGLGVDQLTGIAAGERNGYRANIYKTLVPKYWYVQWCSYSQSLLDNCRVNGLFDKYYCQYGNSFYSGNAYASNAYVYKFNSSVFDGDKQDGAVLDQLTGTGPGQFNLIWYMALLGSNLGWDLQGKLIGINNYQNIKPDDELAYDKIFGYNGPSSGCLGNGSLTGYGPSSQSPMQYLILAQANTNTLYPDSVHKLDGLIDTLQASVRYATAEDVELGQRLRQPLQQAKELLDRAYSQPQGSISATTPTHRTERFISLVENSNLNAKSKRQLTADAYVLMDMLERPAKFEASR